MCICGTLTCIRVTPISSPLVLSLYLPPSLPPPPPPPSLSPPPPPPPPPPTPLLSSCLAPLSHRYRRYRRFRCSLLIVVSPAVVYCYVFVTPMTLSTRAVDWKRRGQPPPSLSPVVIVSIVVVVVVDAHRCHRPCRRQRRRRFLCLRRRALSRCRSHRAAATALPQPPLPLSPPSQPSLPCAAASRCRHRRCHRRCHHRRASVRWLVVALFSTVRFRHRMPSCDRRRSRCRPLRR